MAVTFATATFTIIAPHNTDLVQDKYYHVTLNTFMDNTAARHGFDLQTWQLQAKLDLTNDASVATGVHYAIAEYFVGARFHELTAFSINQIKSEWSIVYVKLKQNGIVDASATGDERAEVVIELPRRDPFQVNAVTSYFTATSNEATDGGQLPCYIANSSTTANSGLIEKCFAYNGPAFAGYVDPNPINHEIIVNLGHQQTIADNGEVTISFMIKNPADMKPHDMIVTTRVVSAGATPIAIVNRQNIRAFTTTVTSTPGSNNVNWLESTDKYIGNQSQTWTYEFELQADILQDEDWIVFEFNAEVHDEAENTVASTGYEAIYIYGDDTKTINSGISYVALRPTATKQTDADPETIALTNMVNPKYVPVPTGTEYNYYAWSTTAHTKVWTYTFDQNPDSIIWSANTFKSGTLQFLDDQGNAITFKTGEEKWAEIRFGLNVDLLKGCNIKIEFPADFANQLTPPCYVHNLTTAFATQYAPTCDNTTADEWLITINQEGGANKDDVISVKGRLAAPATAGSSDELKITSYYALVGAAQVVEYDDTTLSTVLTTTKPLALAQPASFIMIPPTVHTLIKSPNDGATQPTGPITFRYRPTSTSTPANDWYLLEEVTTTEMTIPTTSVELCRAVFYPLVTGDKPQATNCVVSATREISIYPPTDYTIDENKVYDVVITTRGLETATVSEGFTYPSVTGTNPSPKVQWKFCNKGASKACDEDTITEIQRTHLRRTQNSKLKLTVHDTTKASKAPLEIVFQS